MDLQATQPQQAPEPMGGGSMKFTFPSGSRPLEGYTIKRGIGQGGFGEVYYATSDAGKEVAIKLIRRNLDIELRGVMQCLNLKHPNLLSLFDVRTDDQGDNWVVMEYVSGESLEDVLARQPNGMAPEEAMAWFCGIAAGVAYLHDRGIVHRDLKPGNIFNDEGQVKIGDYGLSKFISASRRSGQTESVGTVHYMAPEIANGRYGKEIDIYALGVMLYEFLTGSVPFEGESVGEVLMKHLTAEPDTSALNEPYRSVVARALAKDPERRFHSVTEMIDALPSPITPRVSSKPLPAAVVAVAVNEGAAYGAHGAGAVPPPPPGSAARAAAAGVQAAAGTQDDEPIWRAIRQAYYELKSGYDRANFGTATKLVIWGLAIFLLLNFGWTVILALLFGGMVYGGYRLARTFLLSKAGPAPDWVPTREWFGFPPAQAPGAPNGAGPVAAGPWSPAVPVPPAPPTPPAPPRHVRGRVRMVRQSWRHDSFTLPQKTGRELTTELLGSLLLSATVSAVACIVLLALTVRNEQVQPELFAWLGVTGTLGAWSVLVPSKFWEGRQGDPVMRRFVLFTIGMALGIAVWGADNFLMVELPTDANMPKLHVPAADEIATNMYDREGQPLWAAYLAFFGFMFLVIRWWKQADPLRGSRVSLWSTLVCVMWAAVLCSLWSFPIKWGMMTAATISLAVQLASPWLDPQDRVAKPLSSAA